MEARVQLLGPPAVHVRGGWLPLRPGRADAVVAYLARRGAPVRRSEVAALLWPAAAATQASSNLRQTVRTLTTRPLEPLLGRDRERLWLDASSDVSAFEDALRDGRWSDAATTYRGTFLDGFELDDADEFASWLASERSALAERWRHACLTLIDEAEQRGDHVGALELADRVLRADPLDELVLRRAIAAASGLGDRSGARRRFDAFRTLLEREVGVAPEPATLALVGLADAAIGERQPSPSREPATVPPLADVPGRAPHRASLAHMGRRIVGRADVLDALHERLVDGTERLVTLLAPGGMGKTAVAAAFMERAAAAFPDGFVHVSLEGVADHHGVVPAIADAARIRLDGSAPVVPQLVAALAPRRALLVLDAFERHVEAVDVLDALLRASGSVVRLLVTSRERLHHSWEGVVEVGPLATAGSEPTVAPEASEAAQLFLTVAGRRSEALSDDERALVERVAALLGGAPLALELAAAWTDVMPLDVLCRELERNWDLLSSDEVDRSDRHRDVVAMIRETWERLGADDRAAFARLSVLPGTIDRGVAAAVAGSGWRALRRLVDRALVRRVGDRLELHALLARFGRERADALGLSEAAWDAALEAWVERADAVSALAGGRYRPLAGDDLTQAVGAWRHAVARSNWRALAALIVPVMRGLDVSSRFDELRSSSSSTVEALEASSGAARDVALARLLAWRRAPDRATRRAQIDEALALAERHGDDVALAGALEVLLRHEPSGGDEAVFVRARAAFERSGDLVGLAALFNDRAFELALRGHDGASLRLAEEARIISRRLGDLHGEAAAIDDSLTVPLLHGDAETVRRGIAEARELFAHLRHSHLSIITLATESWLSSVIEDHERAESLAHAFIEANRAYVDDVSGFEATMLINHALRAGAFDDVLRYGETILFNSAGDERPSAFSSLAHLCIAPALVGLGLPHEALAHVRAVTELARTLDAPRIAAIGLVTCAHVAVAVAEEDLAVDLLRRGWRHPAFDRARRNEARDLVLATGRSLDALGPGPGEAPHDDTLHLVQALEAAIHRLDGVVNATRS
jgi:DNA-binding SARP family transcriptional activator/predicted ATPase